jgi:uncharacterized protein YcaQ
MAKVYHLSRLDARRVAIRAQLLQQDRPTGLLSLVRHLTMLQLDPTNAIAPSADLVAWSRLGSSYSPYDLRAALDDRQLVELRAMVRPAEDIALYRSEMADWPGTGELVYWKHLQRDWVLANDRCRREILGRLREAGPLPSRELPDTCERPWASAGWANNKNLAKLLEFMVQRGEVAVAGRKGRDRLWNLAERVYPDVPGPPPDKARRDRDRRRLRALGIARLASPECEVEPAAVGTAGEPAVVEGVRGEWRVEAPLLDEAFHGRAALLSPFDRLVHDRARTAELFEFDYQLEMYKPAAKRQWGYFALPILYGDRLVGKVDAKADHRKGVLEVNAVHQDVPFTGAMRAAIDQEIADLAGWLKLDMRRAG